VVEEAVEWVHKNRQRIEKHLLERGAVVFKGFPMSTVADFSVFAECFGYGSLPYVGGAAPRNRVVGDVFTANEAPPDTEILFHHEMTQAAVHPKKIFFYCEMSPDKGGETCLVLSHKVYLKMVEKHPSFVEKLEKLGLKYTRILPEADDPSSPQGRSWKSTYNVRDKEELEEALKNENLTWEWLPNGDLKTVTKEPSQPIQTDERSGKKIWFNSIVAVYLGWNDSRHKGPECVHFGDGSPLEPETVKDCLDIMNSLAFLNEWQHGDVILLDNRQVLHARKPYEGDRSVFAYLTKS